MNLHSIAPGDSQAIALSHGVQKTRTHWLQLRSRSRTRALTWVIYLQQLSAAPVTALLMSGAASPANALDAKSAQTPGLVTMSRQTFPTAFEERAAPCADTPCVETGVLEHTGTFVPPLPAGDQTTPHPIPSINRAARLGSVARLPLPVRIAFCRWLH